MRKSPQTNLSISDTLCAGKIQTLPRYATTPGAWDFLRRRSHMLLYRQVCLGRFPLTLCEAQSETIRMQCGYCNLSQYAVLSSGSMHKRNKIALVVSLTCLVALGVGSVFVPFVPTVGAEEGVVEPAPLAASLSLTLSAPSLHLTTTPTASGTLIKGETSVNVVSDNLTGYALTMSGVGANTALVHVDGAGSILSTTAAVASPAVLPANTWGYNNTTAAATTTWKRIPSSATTDTIASSAVATGGAGNSVPVAIGVNPTSSLPTGDYGSALVFTVTANAVPGPTVTGVSPGTVVPGTIMTVAGTNFVVNGTNVVAGVSVGGSACLPVTVSSATSLSCTVAAMIFCLWWTR